MLYAGIVFGAILLLSWLCSPRTYYGSDQEESSTGTEDDDDDDYDGDDDDDWYLD